jgi:uncharacterized protein involved in type VI secretion and phage assembly
MPVIIGEVEVPTPSGPRPDAAGPSGAGAAPGRRNEICRPAESGGPWYGVYPALVADLRDPENQGRVLVTLPWAPDTAGGRYAAWARLATLSAGPNSGSWFVPDVGNEVLVAFEAGDARRPYIVGSLWNGKSATPAAIDGNGRNNRKVLKTRGGITITLDDEAGRESLMLRTPAGQTIRLVDGDGRIEIKDTNGNAITCDSVGLRVVAGNRMTLAAGKLEISAGSVEVNAGRAKFTGMVECDTLKANSVISSSYTPGAGNIW